MGIRHNTNIKKWERHTHKSIDKGGFCACLWLCQGTQQVQTYSRNSLKNSWCHRTFMCQHQEATERESLPSLLKSFFQNHSVLIVALNCKRQYLIIIFYNNNSHNRTFVHVIRIVIFNFIVTHGWLLEMKIVIRLILKGV